MNVIVIGGGASGMIAAIYAAKNNHKVTILDKNNVLGKKLLITGNGKCNYWNEDQNLFHYHTQNPEILKQIVTKENQNKILDFIDSIGIIPKIKNGYYYPYSNQSSSVQSALTKEIEQYRITVCQEEVIDIQKHDKFIVKTSTAKYEAEQVIIATGSKACPKTGSTGDGYTFAQSFGHSLIEPLPALVQLKGNEKYFKDWTGIRTDAKVSLYENDVFIKEEFGEIQLTDYGVSGICVFQLSWMVAKGIEEAKKEEIRIQFLPFLDNDIHTFIRWMDERNQKMKGRNVSELLDGVLNYKLVNLLLKLANISKDWNWNDIKPEKKKELYQKLFCFSLSICETNSFEHAQVCSGGIPLSEINPKTMESLNQEGLYLIGELLDVDGDCGGYNLGFSFISGMIAGSSIEVK